MKPKLLLLLLLLLNCTLLFAPPMQNTPLPSYQPGESLKILTWNIYMLPKWVRFTGKEERAAHIGEQLSKTDYDIIVFQEAFLPEARNIIRGKLANKFPFQVGPVNNSSGSLFYHSGVWILSKMPLKTVDVLTFRDCHGFDCFARKGAVLVEGIWKNQPFQLMGTHLQAYAAQEVRDQQYLQLENELLAPNRIEGVPQILAGDFNTPKTARADYKHMLEVFSCEDGPFSGEFGFTYFSSGNDISPDGEDEEFDGILDYALYRSNGICPGQIRRTVPVFQQTWGEGRCDLSDHYPVLLELVF